MTRIKILVLFFLLFVAMSAAQGGPKVTIAEERTRVQGILATLFSEQMAKGSAEILDRNEQIEEYKQYLNLLDLKYKIELAAESKEPKVGIGYFGQLRGVLGKLRESGAPVSIESAYRLFAYLEENKRAWRQPGATPPLPFSDGNLKIGVSLTAHGKILLSLTEQFVVKGLHKGVDHGIGYKKGHGLTRLRSYDSLTLQEMGIKYEGPQDEEEDGPAPKAMVSDPVAKPAQDGKLTKEAEILRKIKNAEPKGPKRGLVDLYSETHDEIVVHSLDGDLEDVYPEDSEDGKPAAPKLDLTRLPYVHRLEGVSQLTDGLVVLKGLGYLHMDLKFSNLLHQGVLRKMIPIAQEAQLQPLVLPLDESPFRFAYCDFGEALYMPEADLNNRPLSGNVFFMAPEVGDRLWYGRNDAEIRELGFRADVFSHALVSYYLLNLRYFPGLLEADRDAHEFVAAQERMGRKTNGNRTYLNSRKQYIEKALREDLYSQEYSSATHLIYRSVASDPRERPSMEQFQMGINYIKTKQTSEATLSSAEIMKQLKDLHIYPYDVRRISLTLSSMQVGNFILAAFQTGHGANHDQFRAAVAYLAKSQHGNQLVFKVLDVDPSNADAVRREIGFLRSIGTLTGQLAFQ